MVNFKTRLTVGSKCEGKKTVYEQLNMMAHKLMIWVQTKKLWVFRGWINKYLNEICDGNDVGTELAEEISYSSSHT